MSKLTNNLRFDWDFDLTIKVRSSLITNNSHNITLTFKNVIELP